LLSDLRNYKYYILDLYKNLNKLPIFRSITKIKAKIEFVMEREIVIEAAIIREETLIIEETSTTFKGNKGYSNKEYKLGELVSEDKIISNTKIFVDVIFYQSLDNDLYYID